MSFIATIITSHMGIMRQTTILSLMAGAVCKLYDDMNDNPLFVRWRNPYVNEYLKGALCVMLIMISEVSLYLITMVLLVNGLQMYYDSKAFMSHPYEFSGMLVLGTYFIYKVCTTRVATSFDYRYAVLCFLVMGTIVANGGTNGFRLFIGYKETEFSVTKLLVRGITFVGLGVALFLNTMTHVVSPSITSVLCFFMGYLAVSCAVQCLSLYMSSGGGGWGSELVQSSSENANTLGENTDPVN
jgi:hypothetical protein